MGIYVYIYMYVKLEIKMGFPTLCRLMSVITTEKSFVIC